MYIRPKLKDITNLVRPPIKFNPPYGPDKNFSKKSNSVFVFGSNLAGVHGGGAAAVAYKKYGAIWGCGFGLQGNSYALPTKDWLLKTLRYTEVAYWVDRFHDWALSSPAYSEIFVTKVGCGLAGYTEKQIAPLFTRYYWPSNVTLPEGWYK